MNKSKKTAFMGLLLALVFLLGILENHLPPIPLLPPSVKLGLANVAGMYCIFFVGRKEALLLMLLKSAFVFFTRGMAAGILSLSGGLLSVFAMLALLYLSKGELSYKTYSIAGAVSHNIGQILAFSAIMKNFYMFYYLPVLLVFGVVMGAVTGGLLKLIMPYFHKLSRYDGYY